MENRTHSHNNLPASVQEMANISLTGNIVPSQWLQSITFDNGKPDTNSILILADICYWHRPTEIRDERSGSVIGYKKKFAEDLLRKSYSDLQTQFGLSDRQLRDCFSRLEKRGVIRRVFRILDSASGRQNNVMYIELIPSAVRTLTNGIPPKPFKTTVSDPINMDCTPYHDRTGQGVTSNVTPITIERDTYPVITGDHIEANITPKITSKISLSPSESISETPDSSSAMDEREKEVSISEKMISIWNDMVPEKAQEFPSKQLHRNLERALKEQLNGNLENWKVVCEAFKSSKFLMGEAEGISFTPSLSWLLDPTKSLVARVFAREHYTFGDRAVAAKPVQDFEATEREIQLSSEVKIVKDVRLFVLQSNPGFYNSYLKQAKLDVGGEGVQLRASSTFAKEKISEAFFEKMKTFLKEKYQMSLELQ